MYLKLEIICAIVFKTVISVAQIPKPKDTDKSYAYLLANDCGYNVIQNDDLPYAEGKNFTFPENCIFFAETSCEGGLTFRQACSVESAARAHPNRQINVLFTVPVTKDRLTKRPLNAVLSYPNVHFYRIHLHKYGKKTPLRSLLRHDLLKSVKFFHHAADVLRFLTLYKFGGIFMDLDAIVVKSFDTLPESTRNFIGKEDDDTFSVGILAFSNDQFGRILANTTVSILKRDFDPYQWIENGIDIFRKALNEVFERNTFKVFTKNGNIVMETPDPRLKFTIYSYDYFYPIHYSEVQKIFQPGILNLTDVYAVHVWNTLSKFMYLTEGSIYSQLANEFCPRTIKMYRFVNTRRSQAKKLYTAKLAGKKLKPRISRTTFKAGHFAGPLNDCEAVSNIDDTDTLVSDDISMQNITSDDISLQNVTSDNISLQNITSN